MADRNAPPLLESSHVELLPRLVSVNVGSRNAACVPSVVRGLAVKLSADRRVLTVFVPASQSAQLLDDVRATRTVAVVLSEPSTHRTIQLKGVDAAVVPLEPGDHETIARYARGMVADLAPFGYPESLFGAVLACAPEDVAAIRFTISAAITQTPGPRAGEKLSAAT
jgi:hypothetical protein